MTPHCLYYLYVLMILNSIIMFQCVMILYHLINFKSWHIVWYSHCRIFISPATIISNVASHRLIPNAISVYKSFTFLCHKLLTDTVYSNQCHGVLIFQILSKRQISRSQVAFGRQVVCHENIYCTITFAFVYPATVLGRFRRGYFQVGVWNFCTDSARLFIQVGVWNCYTALELCKLIHSPATHCNTLQHTATHCSRLCIV